MHCPSHEVRSQSARPLPCVGPVHVHWGGGKARMGMKRSLRHHHLHKLLVVDLAVSVDIGLPDHFVHLLISELLAEVRHYMAQLRRADEAITVAVKTLNASIISSSVSVSFIFRAIKDKNSGKSMVPLPSASTSLIISWSSASVGFWPKERMTVPSSLVVMVPSPSLSNREKASLNSAICSSVSCSSPMIS